MNNNPSDSSASFKLDNLTLTGFSPASPDDREVTKRLAAAGKILSIPLADHVIVTKDTFLSFRDKGLL